MKKIVLRFALALTAVLSISLLSGCVPNQVDTTPPVAPPVAESAPPQCNGSPYWCVKVANESNDSVQMYLDGQVYRTLDGGQVLWVPFEAGSSHMINSCITEHEGSLLFGKDVNKCTDPHNVTMDGNKTYVVHSA
jgi:hypothetical protein